MFLHPKYLVKFLKKIEQEQVYEKLMYELKTHPERFDKIRIGNSNWYWIIDKSTGKTYIAIIELK
jgi:hypothetical protein